MAYTKTTWRTDDVITAEKLNNAEQGIAQNAHDIEDLSEAIESVEERVTNIESTDEIDQLKSDLSVITGVEKITSWQTNKTVVTNQSVGTVIDITPTTKNYTEVFIEDCSEGDAFTINGEPSSGTRLYCFVDSSNKILVNREEIEELISDLRNKTPDEVKRYQKMISNKEAILADAQAKADQIIAQAQIQTNELVSEHQIMQQAYAQANEVVMLATKQAQDILDNATNEANSLRMSAMAYTDDQLRGLEDLLITSIKTTKEQYDTLINSLQGYLDVIQTNRSQLFPEDEVEDENDDVENGSESEEISQENDNVTLMSETETEPESDDELS